MSDIDVGADFFRKMFEGSWITQGLWAAAELGVADQLSAGSASAEELAARTNSHPGALYRLLRALAGVGVFAEDSQGRFELTPLGSLLREDVPHSQRAFAIMMGAEFHAAWGELLHSVKTGQPGFEKRFGMHFFEYMNRHPDRHHFYDAAMESVHGPETEPVLDAYDFSAFRTVVDIGGGNGSALSTILKRHPSLHGILFDMPAVADRARAALADSPSYGRLKVEGGDFFKSVPANADAYLLRHILHDWEDEDAIAILRKCREAMSPSSRILVLEMVIPPGNEPGFGKWLDLMMLLVAGRERTQKEYDDLFSKAGLRLSRVVPTASDISIMEGVPAVPCRDPEYSESYILNTR